MKYSNQYKTNPKDLAKEIIKGIGKNENIVKVEIAGPGFINFFVTKGSQFSVISKILNEKNLFGKNEIGANSNVLIEFVSANPTGPLHVGHGRGAAYGDCLSNLFKENGYNVSKEYYVNDAGKQIDILTISVLQRYHQLIDESINLDYEDLYKGDYVWDIAAEVHRNNSTKFFIKDLNNLYNSDLDTYILNVKNNLSQEKFKKIKSTSVDFILDNIKKTLNISGVDFDSWFSESTLVTNNDLKDIINYLNKNNFTYEKDKALWFKSMDLGDEKDRVLVKENKDHTYLSTDIAYHNNKIKRKFDHVINIWGADHHGYIPRINGAFNI